MVLLQKDIDEISRWVQRWQMKFNINKCVLLRFMRRHLPLINNYTLNNQTIKSSNTYNYLGILLDNSLSWPPHINNITNKPTRMLNFTKRNLSKCNSKVKSDAYTTLVRPILECATQVWDPHQQNLIYKLEMAQRRATRWVQSDYSFQSSITTML